MVGRLNIWTLAYADDIVFITIDEEGMGEMIKNLERCIEKKVAVNVVKPKIMMFRRRGRKKKLIE